MASVSDRKKLFAEQFPPSQADLKALDDAAEQQKPTKPPPSAEEASSSRSPPRSPSDRYKPAVRKLHRPRATTTEDKDTTSGTKSTGDHDHIQDLHAAQHRAGRSAHETQKSATPELNSRTTLLEQRSPDFIAPPCPSTASIASASSSAAPSRKNAPPRLANGRLAPASRWYAPLASSHSSQRLQEQDHVPPGAVQSTDSLVGEDLPVGSSAPSVLDGNYIFSLVGRGVAGPPNGAAPEERPPARSNARKIVAEQPPTKTVVGGSTSSEVVQRSKVDGLSLGTTGTTTREGGLSLEQLEQLVVEQEDSPLDNAAGVDVCEGSRSASGYGSSADSARVVSPKPVFPRGGFLGAGEDHAEDHVDDHDPSPSRSSSWRRKWGTAEDEERGPAKTTTTSSLEGVVRKSPFGLVGREVAPPNASLPANEEVAGREALGGVEVEQQVSSPTGGPATSSTRVHISRAVGSPRAGEMSPRKKSPRSPRRGERGSSSKQGGGDFSPRTNKAGEPGNKSTPRSRRGGSIKAPRPPPISLDSTKRPHPPFSPQVYQEDLILPIDAVLGVGGTTSATASGTRKSILKNCSPRLIAAAAGSPRLVAAAAGAAEEASGLVRRGGDHPSSSSAPGDHPPGRTKTMDDHPRGASTSDVVVQNGGGAAQGNGFHERGEPGGSRPPSPSAPEPPPGRSPSSPSPSTTQMNIQDKFDEQKPKKNTLGTIVRWCRRKQLVLVYTVLYFITATGNTIYFKKTTNTMPNYSWFISQV